MRNQMAYIAGRKTSVPPIRVKATEWISGINAREKFREETAEKNEE
jgi:hypothetical protein